METYRVEISDMQSALKIDASWLASVVRHAMAHLRLPPGEVSVVLLGDAAIQSLNRRHLNHDWPTDVVTFPISEPDESAIHGEIVISTETAIREATRLGHGPAREVALYAIHGVLHLAGFDDHEPSGVSRMREMEREIMSGVIWV
jgi:probable rRNA maturation factor